MTWASISEQLHVDESWIRKLCRRTGKVGKVKVRIPQHKIDEIFRLRRDTDWSESKIGRGMGLHHSSINRILKKK